MNFKDIEDLPISWADHEDIAIKLYDKFGEEFNESKIYRIRFTDLIEWVLELPYFEGKREDCSEGHLEMIQAKWVYEWRDNNS
jgi:FeS assembly protein IscX